MPWYINRSGQGLDFGVREDAKGQRIGVLAPDKSVELVELDDKLRAAGMRLLDQREHTKAVDAAAALDDLRAEKGKVAALEAQIAGLEARARRLQTEVVDRDRQIAAMAETIEEASAAVAAARAESDALASRLDAAGSGGRPWLLDEYSEDLLDFVNDSRQAVEDDARPYKATAYALAWLYPQDEAEVRAMWAEWLSKRGEG